MFSPLEQETVYVSRSDATDLLAAWSKHGFELDGIDWPSVEHYYQGMKFADPVLREAIRSAPHPKEARKIARKNRRRVVRDWKSVRKVHMTRAVYLKCRTHPEVAEALLATGTAKIVETSQYDYYWGCGRDGRGENSYGKVLAEVRGKLRELAVEARS
jgi:ribA/ribD-fused uncharacterized protein